MKSRAWYTRVKIHTKRESADPIHALLPLKSNLPLEIARNLIEENSTPNAIILDPFSAGGAVAVEALRLNRRAVLLERDPITALFAEVVLRPCSLPLLEWAFQDVRELCREGMAGLYATACPRCGNRGVIESIYREKEKTVRIEYTCPCSPKILAKKPDADDRRNEKDAAHLKIPFWYSTHLALEPTLNFPAVPEAGFTNRRTVAGLLTILDAIEHGSKSSTYDLLRAVFAKTLEKCYSFTKRNSTRPDRPREDNPWKVFEAGYRQLYQMKMESNRLLKDAAIGHSFADLSSGRANVVILGRNAGENLADLLPKDSIDGVITAIPRSLTGDENPLTAIQAEWLSIKLMHRTDFAADPGRAANHEEYREDLLAAFSTVCQAGKEGCGGYFFLGDGGPELHGLLNLLEKSGLGVDQIVYQPAPGRLSASGGYLLQTRICNLESTGVKRIAQDALELKLESTARTRVAIHGAKTTAGLIVHSFYQQLDRAEIASVSQLAIDDWKQKAAAYLARYRGKKRVPKKGKARSGGKIAVPAEWSQAVIDTEVLARSDPTAAHAIRRAMLRRFTRAGFTAEDADAIRARLRGADIDRRRRDRVTNLLRGWGKALGYPIRSGTDGHSGVVWQTGAGRAVAFRLGKNTIEVTSQRKNQTQAVWGSLSDLDLEFQFQHWQSAHPDLDKGLSKEGLLRIPLSEMKTFAHPKEPSPVRDRRLKVIQNRKICDRHFLITMELAKGMELEFIPGQFFHLVCDPEGKDKRPYPLTLRRPLSIHRVEAAGFDCAALAWARDLPEEIRSGLVRPSARIEFLYRVVGEGTERLSHIRKGAVVNAIGPCGNGFTIGAERTAVIVAGGIGIAPLAALAEELRYRGKEVLVYIGAIEKEMLHLAVTRAGETENDPPELLDAVESEFGEIGAQILTVCTDDGSVGEKALVTEMLARGIRDGCVPRESVCLYACGPKGMLRAVAEIAARNHLDCQVSLEERMACGIGACHSCTVTVVNPDGAAVKKRVCREGPVFHARDIQWKD